jgi:hypothetical protein
MSLAPPQVAISRECLPPTSHPDSLTPLPTLCRFVVEVIHVKNGTKKNKDVWEKVEWENPNLGRISQFHITWYDDAPLTPGQIEVFNTHAKANWVDNAPYLLTNERADP